MKRKVELLLMAMALIVLAIIFFTRNNNKMCITCGTDRAASDH